MSKKKSFYSGNLFKEQILIFHMVPTQNSEMNKMNSRETILCRLLDLGGKCLDNESPAFNKKV